MAKAKKPLVHAVTLPMLASLYLDHPKVGCGWRLYLVTAIGPKWVKVTCTETADSLSIPRAEFDRMKPQPMKLVRTRVARRLRIVATCYGLEKTAAVRAALAMLKHGGN
jgi:hypothetical protein